MLNRKENGLMALLGGGFFFLHHGIQRDTGENNLKQIIGLQQIRHGGSKTGELRGREGAS